MADWFNRVMENFQDILMVLGLVIASILTALIVVYAIKWILYLWHKRILLVDRNYYTQLMMLREKVQAEGSVVSIDQFTSLFEALATVVEHKDKLVKVTGESLKKLDNKFDSLLNTIALLEETNKQLRNREAVIDKLKSIKLLISLIDEIDKFSSQSNENYLEFIQDNINTVLIGLGVEPFDQEFLESEDLLKYYKLTSDTVVAPYKVEKHGYFVRMPDSNYVVKQALISSRGI